ncbi:hypothetical protein ACSFBE_04040 [Variovorax sp. ZT4R33]
MTSEFLGARASNAGDDFHELWAARHAIRLLSGEDDLQAITLEGVAAEDEAGAPSGTWDAVDCALYFGSEHCEQATRVVIEQLKYSAAAPTTLWTIARFSYASKPGQSVLGKLARAWSAMRSRAPSQAPIEVKLVSNQSAAVQLVECVNRLAQAAIGEPWPSGSDEERLAKAVALPLQDQAAFWAALHFETGAGSRFAAEERVLAEISRWSESDVLHGVLRLREYVNARMRPEHAGQVITRRAVFLHYGAYSSDVLLPCPAALVQVDRPIKRQSAELAMQAMSEDVQLIALHGQGGIGKTTVLQEIRALLPDGSAMVVFDCYGGGTYQDPSAFRHRATDAYMQLINQTAIQLGLPLLLARSGGDDLPRLFVRRLEHAAATLRARQPGALLVVAIDAADNAIIAAEGREPAERAFVLDFVRIETIPENVRFIVSARTGRLSQLDLPPSYKHIELLPFDLAQTTEFVLRRTHASEQWISDFHDLSGGVPRVQSYALDQLEGNPEAVLNRLRPTGKNLDDVFGTRLDAATRKSGRGDVERLCAGLITMPRPIPVDALAHVASLLPNQVLDICSDMAPGVKLRDALLSFADEDFEEFLRRNAVEMAAARKAAASWMLAQCAVNPYAAMHVAQALVATDRHIELIELVDREPSPAIIADPVIRREAEIARLRLAIQVCRTISDVPRALQFVLRGAEGMKTEAALRDLLLANPEMAAAFAFETVGRLLLSDPKQMDRHGPFLFHRMAFHAQGGNAALVRESRRMLGAWLDARRAHQAGNPNGTNAWPIEYEHIGCLVESALLTRGVDSALEVLDSWRPSTTIALAVGLRLPTKLINAGYADSVEALCASDALGPIGKLLCSVPLANAGRMVPDSALSDGLAVVCRRLPAIRKYFEQRHSTESRHGALLRAAVAAAEILIARKVPCPAADHLLEELNAPDLRRIERRSGYEPERLDTLLRSFTLQRIRSGHEPSPEDFFIPRPAEPADPAYARRGTRQHEQEHDADLKELVGLVFAVYRARARAIVGEAPMPVLAAELTASASKASESEYRRRHSQQGRDLKVAAAISLMDLVAVGLPPALAKQSSDALHWSWVDSGLSPSEELVARQSLCAELHPALAAELVRAAESVLRRRAGASEKCANMVELAKLLRPISPHDANAVFNNAVQVAAHIDREAMSQIELLEKLITRGAGQFSAQAELSRNATIVVADASLRLDGYDGFPWSAAMSALARLDGPRALADVTRWDDENVVELRSTLPDLLQAGLAQGWLPPAHASSLALLTSSDGDTVNEAVALAIAAESDEATVLAEAAALDALIRHRRDRNPKLSQLVQQAGLSGQWCSALLAQEAFVESMPKPHSDRNSTDYVSTKPQETFVDRPWTLLEVTDADMLHRSLDARLNERRVQKRYDSVRSLLRQARHAVPLRDRIKHLDALRLLTADRNSHDTSWALVDAAQEWKATSPAVAQWCKSYLPERIRSSLVHYAKPHGCDDDRFETVLTLVDLQPTEITDLMLAGIGANVSRLSAERVHHLVGMLAQHLSARDAANLAQWYASRLVDRLTVADRVTLPADSVYPTDVDTAAAGMVFACLGDPDLRVRWRAAHAARRLAATGCVAALLNLASMYEARQVPAFRSVELPFYWLAARLWFVLAWERIAHERPEVALQAGDVLLGIALSEELPHMLVRAVARDACLALITAGWMPQRADARAMLERVNKSSVPHAKQAVHSRRRGLTRGRVSAERTTRFHFDEMDTKPYWYSNIVSGFSNVDLESFCAEADRWIVDMWGADEDTNRWDREPRRKSLERYNYNLTNHSHGSLPTVERFSTYLEWHAMWCAAGELHKTEPQPKPDLTDGGWGSLHERIRAHRPAEPPLWSIDLVCPTPLVPQNWYFSLGDARGWVESVDEGQHRQEIFPDDRAEYAVVYARVTRRLEKQEESIEVSSALADHRTAPALIRALQTMESAWDYRLPAEEDGDAEESSGSFRLTGWLHPVQADRGLDSKDEFKGTVAYIPMRPGRIVTQHCSLVREIGSFMRWSRSDAADQAPMFLFESWGAEPPDDRYSTGFSSEGHRLLAHRRQLGQFLNDVGFDLIVEVEVDRSEKSDRQFAIEKEESRAQFDRIYRLTGDDELSLAEVHLGTWLGDRR